MGFAAAVFHIDHCLEDSQVAGWEEVHLDNTAVAGDVVVLINTAVHLFYLGIHHNIFLAIERNHSLYMMRLARSIQSPTMVEHVFSS